MTPEQLPHEPAPLEWHQQYLPEQHRPIGQAAVRQVWQEFDAAANEAFADYLAEPSTTGDTEQDSYDRITEVMKHLHHPLDAAEIEEARTEAGSYQSFAELGRVDIVDAVTASRGDPASGERGSIREAEMTKQADLEGVRKVLQNYVNSPEDGHRYVARSIDADLEAVDDMPPIFEKWRDEAAIGSERPSWPAWLGLYASNDRLLNFLQWHNNRLEKFNTDPAVQEQIEERRSRFIDGLEGLYAQDALEPYGKQAVITRLQNMDIYLADPLKLAMESTNGATYDRTKLRPYFLIKPELALDESRKTFEHELAHLVEDAEDRPMAETGADYIAGAVRAGSLHPSMSGRNCA